MKKDLTSKQQKFVHEYLVDGNATQAAVRAGYSKQSADKIGSELLGKTRVSDAISEAQKRLSERSEISADSVVRELASVAFSDITDVAAWTGENLSLKHSSELPKNVRLAIQSVVIRPGENGPHITIKMHDKIKALEMLGKRFNIFDQSGKDAQSELTDAIKQLDREEQEKSSN